MTISVVVGNPKSRSRTLDAAVGIARKLTGEDPGTVIDLADIGAGLFDRNSAELTRSIEEVRASGSVIFACPTYKGSYTGLLKLFLDQFPGGGLKDITAFPLMLGAGLGHAMAPDLLLKPVLVELGATCPVRGLYLLEQTYQDDPQIEEWVSRARAFVGR